MKRKDVVSYLKSCNDFEIYKLFYEVISEKKEYYKEKGNETTMIDDAFVISRATFREPPADFTVVAMPRDNCKGYVSDTLTQNGFCDKCQIEMVGFAKDNKCPICDQNIWMT